MTTFSFGNLNGAILLLLISFLLGFFLCLATYLRRESYFRRFSGRRLFWEMWGTPILLTVALVSLFYWFLLWRPFYSATLNSEGDWTITQIVPKRETLIQADTIQTIEAENVRISVSRGRARLKQIEFLTLDGQRFISAPMDPTTADERYQEILIQLP